MRLSSSPDFRPPLRLFAVGLAVAGLVAGLLAAKLDVRTHFGDPDDALRLVMVRDLLAGQGWYHPAVTRLAPPHGLYMHWSRLVDGGLAALRTCLGLVLPAGRAEWMTRVLWPVAWIFPAVICALCVARNLGDRTAVMIAAILLLVDLEIYRQFIPSRIDHHNVQIVMTLVSLACVISAGRRPLWGAVGGAATALGLAIGLEAIAFQAILGGAWAVRAAIDRRNGPATAAYGGALAFCSVAAFAVQTPPWRWSLSACDALGLNLVCALTVAGLGLAATALVAARSPAWARWALIAATGLAAGGVYLALDPVCIHGPFAGMLPEARRLWLDGVEEVQPLNVIFRIDRVSAIDAVVVLCMSLASLVVLLRGAHDQSTVIASLVLALAIVSACLAWRMLDYVFWVGLPMIAAAVSRIAARRLGDLLVPTVAVSILLSPTTLAVAANGADKVMSPRAPRGPANAQMDRCFAPSAFGVLRRLPPGLVLSEPDMGPYILAFTPQSVVAAPYHRLGSQIVAAHEALDAAPSAAAGDVRSLGVAYIVDCSGVALEVGAGSLGARLRAGETPGWLERLSPRGAILAIFRVRPA